jgi:hypothetical protein
MPQIGFVILSHSNPTRLFRLITRITELYEPVGIVCHHDFSQTPLEERLFPGVVTFVRPHITTAWGHISIVWAIVRALRHLYETADPDWFTLLSESDYPTKNGKRVLHDLEATPHDAFLDYRMIEYNRQFEQLVRAIRSGRQICKQGEAPWWNALVYERYFSVQFPVPSVLSRRRRFAVLRHPWFVWPFHCFSSKLRCFAGDLWFTGNRRVAKRIINDVTPSANIMQHFALCRIPDEAVFQTILCNQPDLSICPNNRRYADWSAGGSHPKELRQDDLPNVLRSGADFARKVGRNNSVMDAIDEAIQQ